MSTLCCFPLLCLCKNGHRILDGASILESQTLIGRNLNFDTLFKK